MSKMYINRNWNAGKAEKELIFLAVLYENKYGIELLTSVHHSQEEVHDEIVNLLNKFHIDPLEGCNSDEIFEYDTLCVNLSEIKGEEETFSKERENLIKALKKRVEQANQYMVVEMCPYCESEIEMRWDAESRGYKAFCPVCGQRLMLCDECQHSGPDGEFTGNCDFCTETDSCYRNPVKKETLPLTAGTLRRLAAGKNIPDLEHFLRDRPDDQNLWLLNRNDYLAVKLWSEDDIKDSLLEEGYAGTKGEVSMVVDSELLEELNDCTDTDWKIIRDAIKETVERRYLLREKKRYPARKKCTSRIFKGNKKSTCTIVDMWKKEAELRKAAEMVPIIEACVVADDYVADLKMSQKSYSYDDVDFQALQYELVKSALPQQKAATEEMLKFFERYPEFAKADSQGIVKSEPTQKAFYKGQRVLLIKMQNEPYPPQPLTWGTVKSVDDMGQVHMSWDAGGSIALQPGEDWFLTEDNPYCEVAIRLHQNGMLPEKIWKHVKRCS
ncbi:DUF4314 domain-containing protein [Anaerovoracaceae bacterium 42-11]